MAEDGTRPTRTMSYTPARLPPRDPGTIAGQSWDLVVVGGGVTGAWIARDAALRGLRVALVEKDDFSSGASSQNLRTIHGGLRYLQHLDLRRTRESIRERSMWLRVAPHLVEPLPFVLPTYRRGLQRRPLLRIALAAADLAGWDRNRGLDPARVLPGSRMVSRQECLHLVPEAEAPDLTGAVMFHDAQMYSPDRLVLAVLLGAVEDGAAVVNHMQAETVHRADGSLRVQCRDGPSGQTVVLRARAVVNATGSQALEVAEQLGLVSAPTDLTQSIGLNVVVENLGHAVAFATEGREADPNARLKMGARRLFVAPWRGRTLIGTAHYSLDGAGTVDTDAHVERFLAEVNAPGTGLHVEPDQVLQVQWGLLPAVDGSEPVQLLRHHRIQDHGDVGMPEALSVTSVKFTTARLVAEQTVNRVFQILRLRAVPCRTANTRLPGGRFASWSSLREEALGRSSDGLPAGVLDHLAHVFGDQYGRILDFARGSPELRRRVQSDSPVIVAQLVHGIRAELACTAEDLLYRRTELGARGEVTPAARRLAEGLLSEGVQA